MKDTYRVPMAQVQVGEKVKVTMKNWDEVIGFVKSRGVCLQSMELVIEINNEKTCKNEMILCKDIRAVSRFEK